MGAQNLDQFEVRCFCLETATELEIERQILAHVGEPTTAPAKTPKCLPLVEVNGQQLIGPAAVEAIPKQAFDQTMG